MDSRRTFVKQLGIGTAGILFAPSSLLDLTDNLPRSTPESQGVSSEVLSKLFDAMDASDIQFHGVMVLRNGFVIGEGWWAPYSPQYKHTLHSLSKSFTSAAVGLAINEGHFTIESPVISFFPEYAPQNISTNLAAMKVKHLLTMTTGHIVDTNLRTDDMPWVQSFLAAPIEREPGTFYLYNTTATYILSAIVQKTTGVTLLEYLTPRLLKPLKIEGADWQTSPQGINTGGFGLRVRTEDIASFSQLYLNKGKWKGKQILPETWVDASTREQWTFSSNPFGGKKPKAEDDWQQGYGYQFWRTQHNGFRSDGLYGQFGIVLPDEKTVIAITEESFNTQRSLDFVWEILVPGLQKTILPANKEALQLLKSKQKQLQVKLPSGVMNSETTDRINRKRFVLNANSLNARSVIFSFSNNACELVVQYDQGKRTLNLGLNSWEKKKNGYILNSQLPFPVTSLPNVASGVAGRATWKDPNTLLLDIRPVETVNGDTITCTFNKNTVKLAFLNSVAKAKKEQDNRPELSGHIG